MASSHKAMAEGEERAGHIIVERGETNARALDNLPSSPTKPLSRAQPAAAELSIHIPGSTTPTTFLPPSRQFSYGHRQESYRSSRFQTPKGIKRHNSSRHTSRYQSKNGSPSHQKKKKPKAIQEHKHYNWILAGSSILCFNAGFINALTLNTRFSAPSAHVTGMVARTSIALPAEQWRVVEQLGAGYLCFLTGCIISGVLIQNETFYLGRAYGRVFLLIALVLALALAIENIWDDHIFYVWACALACGIQNGLTSKYSGNALRTTHLTGATTDLGVAIGHVIKGRTDELWRIILHTNSTVSFFLGGSCGFWAFQEFKHVALLVNMALVTVCGLVHTIYIAYHENLKFLVVLESSQDIRLHRHRVLSKQNSRSSFSGLERHRSRRQDCDWNYAHHDQHSECNSIHQEAHVLPHPGMGSKSPSHGEREGMAAAAATAAVATAATVTAIEVMESPRSQVSSWAYGSDDGGAGEDEEYEIMPEEETEEEYDEGDVAAEVTSSSEDYDGDYDDRDSNYYCSDGGEFKEWDDNEDHYLHGHYGHHR